MKEMGLGLVSFMIENTSVFLKVTEERLYIIHILLDYIFYIFSWI